MEERRERKKNTHTYARAYTYIPVSDEAIQDASPLRRFLLDGKYRPGQRENSVVGVGKQGVQPPVGREGAEAGSRVFLAV